MQTQQLPRGLGVPSLVQREGEGLGLAVHVRAVPLSPGASLVRRCSSSSSCCRSGCISCAADSPAWEIFPASRARAQQGLEFLLELSNPRAFISPGVVDCVALTSGALLGWLVWSSGREESCCSALWVQLWSQGCFSCLCPGHRGPPAPTRSGSSPAWALGGGERSSRRQRCLFSRFSFGKRQILAVPAAEMGEFEPEARTTGWSKHLPPLFQGSRCSPMPAPAWPRPLPSLMPWSCCGSALQVLQTFLCPRRRSRPLALNLLSFGWSEGLSGAELQLCKRQHVAHRPCPCAGQSRDGWRPGPVPGADISWQEVSPPTWAGAASRQRQDSAPARHGCPGPGGGPVGRTGARGALGCPGVTWPPSGIRLCLVSRCRVDAMCLFLRCSPARGGTGTRPAPRRLPSLNLRCLTAGALLTSIPWLRGLFGEEWASLRGCVLAG